MKSLLERFETKYEPEPNTGCWIWLASRDGYGYGQIASRRNQAPFKAYRIAYEMFIGPIPDGLELDHLCRVRACVNPDHLDPVTHQINALRGYSPTSINAKKLACAYGHTLDADNTYTWSGPRQIRMRQCRTCRARRRKESRLAGRG